MLSRDACAPCCRYVAKNFMEVGSGKIEIFPARAAEEGKRSESNIGMIVMSACLHAFVG